jgi:DegV family protein with EDD domain
VTVRIVTDSAADIPPQLASDKNVTVVPLTVRFGDDSYRSGVDLSADEFWQKLKTSTEAPATAAPSAGEFQTAFEELIANGATGIVSVHLSSKLSATYQSAVVAAQEIKDVPVEVVDTLAVSAGTGLVALGCAERAEGGATAADIAAQARTDSERIRLYGAIDTLEYLRRGGRIGGAQALLGSMLKVKPVISLEDGVVEPVTRVRTRAKSLEHIAQIVAEAKENTERLVVLSADAPDIEQFLTLLEPTIKVAPSDVWEFGPIVGTHGGPGLIGLAFLTKAGDGGSAPA